MICLATDIIILFPALCPYSLELFVVPLSVTFEVRNITITFAADCPNIHEDHLSLTVIIRDMLSNAYYYYVPCSLPHHSVRPTITDCYDLVFLENDMTTFQAMVTLPGALHSLLSHDCLFSELEFDGYRFFYFYFARVSLCHLFFVLIV